MSKRQNLQVKLLNSNIAINNVVYYNMDVYDIIYGYLYTTSNFIITYSLKQ